MAASGKDRRGRRGSLLSAQDFDLPASPDCPFCGGARTELHSPFGPQLSVATYWCLDCHTAFEYLKWGLRD